MVARKKYSPENCIACGRNKVAKRRKAEEEVERYVEWRGSNPLYNSIRIGTNKQWFVLIHVTVDLFSSISHRCLIANPCIALELRCAYGSVSVPDGLAIYSATNINRADKDAGVTALPDMQLPFLK